MNKRLALFLPIILLLSGCATYKFQKGQSPYDQGFVVSRYDKTILEYTVGKNNTVPDEQIAKERFKRRKAQVEYYYKKMGYIQNRFKGMFIDPPVFLVEFVVGIFRMPFIAVSDYKYNHNPKYKEEMDKKDELAYKAEKERIKQLRDKLNAYVEEDLEKESAPKAAMPLAKEDKKTEQAVTAPIVTEPVKEEALPQESALEKVKEDVPVIPVETAPAQPAKAEIVPPPKESLSVPQAKVQSHPDITAQIIAKPTRGPSPLKVQFYSTKCSAPKSRIVSYAWDFGDGDVSSKKNPSNTYWSTIYGSRIFTATLTIKDDKGSTASSSIDIEVLNR